MADIEDIEIGDDGPEDAAPDNEPDAAAEGSADREPPTAIHESLIDTWAVLGKVSIPVKQLIRVGRGAVIVLDRALNDPIEIRANNRLIARGEVVIVDEKIGVAITEMVGIDAARQEN